MGLADRVRKHLDHAAAVRRYCARIVELQAAYHDDPDTVTRLHIADQMEALVLATADHLEASRFARWVTFLPSPGALRATAGVWRECAVKQHVRGPIANNLPGLEG